MNRSFLKISFIAVLFLLTLSAHSYATEVEENDFDYAGIRNLGMGGAFIGFPADYNAPLTNPAGMSFLPERYFYILDTRIGVNDDIKYFVDAALSLKDDLGESMTSDQMTKIADIVTEGITKKPQIFATMPLNIGITAKSWAIGITNRENVAVRLFGLAPVYNIDVNFRADVLAFAAISHKFTPKLSVGLTGKYLVRTKIAETYNLLELAGGDFTPKLDLGFGIGADAGVFYNVFDSLSVGVTVKNFISSISWKQMTLDETGTSIPLDSTKLPMNIGAGIAFKPDIKIPLKIFKNPIFVLDMDDITNTDKNIFKKIHAGFSLDALWLFNIRGGINQGWTTFGVGVDLFFLQLEYAYYGQELGVLPGQIPEYKHMASLAVRF